MRVSVIIPTHNEAQAIGRVLADLPICLPISSRRSSLSTAIRLTERPISPERWGHKLSRSLAGDTGALV